jgi:arrestin-related trafficking adapter 4/5/7
MEVLERVGLETSKMGGEHTYATTLSDRVVASTETQMPPDSMGQLTEETSGFADESYHFKVNLPLKRSLNSFRQSVNTEHIKIYHNLKVYVNIHNPDGHVSQLCLRNLVHVYISPSIPIGDDQSVCQESLNALPQDDESNLEAPPTYGTHLLDQLYEDIDPSGFLSGVNTPFRGMSRNVSVENLGSLMANANTVFGEGSELPATRTPSPTDPASQLQFRLAALEDRRPPTPRIVSSTSSGYNTPNIDESYFQHVNSTYTPSAPSSARTSGIYNPRRSLLHRHSNSYSAPPSSFTNNESTTTLNAPQTNGTSVRGPNQLSHAYRQPPPGHISIIQPDGEFDMAALARIPSYSTAMRTPFAGSPESEELPSYEYVCGTTPQPMTPQQPLTPPAEEGYPPSYSQPRSLQAPQTAHVRGRSLGGQEDLSRLNSGQPRGSITNATSIASQGRASGTPFGGGSLQGLWSYHRRGST